MCNNLHSLKGLRPNAFEESSESPIKVFILLLVLGVIEVGASGCPTMVHGGVELVGILGRERLSGDRLDDFLVLATGHQ